VAAMIRIMFPLIGYFCTATVITLVAGFGYLRSSEALDDEHVFRIVSILHDIDFENIAEAHGPTEDEVPPEESSYDQQIEYRQVESLHLQSKQDDLEQQLGVFKDRFKRLNVETARYRMFKKEVEQYLLYQEKRATESGLVAVRTQLRNLNAEKQAKPLLVQWIKENRIEDVILLLNGLTDRTRRDIIRTFDEPEDIEMLKSIYEQMLAGHPEKTYIEGKLRDLQQLKDRDR
jgi:hypothetical protein